MVRGFRDSGDLDARIGPLQIQPLTDDQTRFVKDLFQKYVPEEMSAEDAVEIIDALDGIGIRGPGVRALVLTAGLDPQKFKTLISIEAAHRF
jgi:hypothetical protein